MMLFNTEELKFHIMSEYNRLEKVAIKDGIFLEMNVNFH